MSKVTGIADQLKAQVRRYYTEKCYAVNAEMGLNSGGALRADLLAVNMKGEVIVIEVKSGVPDFRSDKKWHKYLPFCNKFYFAVTARTYEKIKADIPKGIGVFVVRKFDHKDNERVITHSTYKMRMVKRAEFREMDPQTKLSVVIRMAFRNADFNRYARRSRQ